MEGARARSGSLWRFKERFGPLAHDPPERFIHAERVVETVGATVQASPTGGGELGLQCVVVGHRSTSKRPPGIGKPEKPCE